MGTDQLLEYKGADKKFPDDAWVAAPVKKGSLVLIHGQVSTFEMFTPLKFAQSLSLLTFLRSITSRSAIQVPNQDMHTPSISLRQRDHTMQARIGYNQLQLPLFLNCIFTTENRLNF